MDYLKGLTLVAKHAASILPKAGKELDSWEQSALKIKNVELRKQALASINSKKFHIQGGSVYALYPGIDELKTIKFITALQTISDYLDNLCDRVGVYDTKAFSQLHLSMLDAVEPDNPIHEYYKYYTLKDDGGYLNKLVHECRDQIKGLPSYHMVLPFIKKYIKLYSELQTYKHADLDKRLPLLIIWAKEPMSQYPGLEWWEFAAAAGSTLGVFLMYALAYDPKLTPEEADAVNKAYFPWVCGLHILLDYFIDYQEDLQMGDLNFTYYYENLHHCEERMKYILQRAIEVCSDLKYPDFHITIIKGLLALYLSDPKAFSEFGGLAAHSLLRKGGRGTLVYYRICRLLRLCRIV